MRCEKCVENDQGEKRRCGNTDAKYRVNAQDTKKRRHCYCDSCYSQMKKANVERKNKLTEKNNEPIFQPGESLSMLCPLSSDGLSLAIYEKSHKETVEKKMLLKDYKKICIPF